MENVDDAQSSALKFFFPTCIVQPIDAVGIVGGQVSFTAGFNSTNPALVSFRWQAQLDGTTWKDIVETPGIYENTTTTTLTVKAIDNFLASLPSVRFRCRALFANAVPSFSNSARLTVPIYLTYSAADWTPSLTQPPQNAVFDFGAPTPVGFTGPLTYLWTDLSGQLLLLTPTHASTTATTLVAPVGITSFAVQVTVSDGTNTVTSDKIFGVYLPTPAPVSPDPFEPAVPSLTSNGAAMATDPTSTFVGPWQIGFQDNKRTSVVPSVTIDSPAQASTSFTFPPVTTTGGAEVRVLANAVANFPAGQGNCSFSGISVWL